MTSRSRVVEVDIRSSFDMVDWVHAIFESIAQEEGFEAEAAHYMSVAIRESVTNAVRHGNKMNPDKRVVVRFEYQAPRFSVSVEDEGEGFVPEDVPDPLAEENLLRANGRGIFFMKSFMDEVVYRFPANRGTQVVMIKRVGRAEG